MVFGNAPKPSRFCSLLTRCTIPCACHAKRHLNVQKWLEHVVFLTFWLRNVLRATTACTFKASGRQTRHPTPRRTLQESIKNPLTVQDAVWGTRRETMGEKTPGNRTHHPTKETRPPERRTHHPTRGDMKGHKGRHGPWQGGRAIGEKTLTRLPGCIISSFLSRRMVGRCTPQSHWLQVRQQPLLNAHFHTFFGKYIVY